nr:uncharacterized protein LOC129255961 [Lytechinus pictus]
MDMRQIAHVFFYDGFIGLKPGERYTVSALTLPTRSQWDNYVSKEIRIPWESCWVPDLKIHETPFAVNVTLFQDLSYGFQRFDVHLYDDTDRARSLSVDFSTADICEMDGKNGTNILFECIEPTTAKLKLYVASEECRFCQWNKNKIQVQGIAPTFTNCPEHDIIREVEMRKPMIEVTPVNWSPPTPVFQGSCGTGYNSSRDPDNTAFRVGTTTSIRNVAWQYSSVSECTFNVEVRAVDTTPPKIICPDNISTYGDPKNKTFKVSWRKPSFDDASDTVLTVVTPDIPSNQTSYNFPVFVNTTVKYQITDAYNNVASCRFFVYVKGDTDPPHILYCPRNIMVNGQPKMKSAEIHWDRPQFDDTSDTVMTIVTPNIPNDETFFTFPVGVNTTVKYKITDAYNNTAHCNFSVYIKETPAASPLVITLSCLAGVLLIVVVLALVCAKRYKGMKPNERGSKEKLEPSEVTFKPVDPLKPSGIDLESLINCSGSQLSIDRSRKNIYPSQGPLQRRRSDPELSSGFCEGEFIPSFGHPHLESVTEELEREHLVYRPNEEDRSSNGSKYSSSCSDDSPVSLESTC